MYIKSIPLRQKPVENTCHYFEQIPCFFLDIWDDTERLSKNNENNFVWVCIVSLYI